MKNIAAGGNYGIHWLPVGITLIDLSLSRPARAWGHTCDDYSRKRSELNVETQQNGYFWIDVEHQYSQNARYANNATMTAIVAQQNRTRRSTFFIFLPGWFFPSLGIGLYFSENANNNNNNNNNITYKKVLMLTQSLNWLCSASDMLNIIYSPACIMYLLER